MSIEALQATEVQVENVADLAQFIAAAGGSQGQQIVQVSDVTAPILQVQDALANGTIIQVSDTAVTPLVQVTDQAQGIFITDGLSNGVQILDGSFPIIQGNDGNIIQLAQPIMSGGNTEGLTQVVQFPNGQIALIEQQENIDPQTIQHLVFEQVPPQVVQTVDEASQAQPTENKSQPAPLKPDIQPPVGKGPFKCETCEKVFPKWNQLQRHMKHHEEDKPHQCIHCTASFNIVENLKLHEATHVEEGQKPECPECSKTFSRVASLKAHIMLHEREESLMCAECGDEFALQADGALNYYHTPYLIDMIRYGSEVIPDLDIPVPDQFASLKGGSIYTYRGQLLLTLVCLGQLDRHLKEHRDAEMGQKVYNCRQCTQEFNKPALLKEHMKQHYKIKTSLSHKTYKKVIDRSGFSQKCSFCLKSFQKPSQLERHVRVHTGERPYKCNICQKAFNQKGALQIHMTKHTGQKSHNCQFCSQTFAQKGNLRAHIQRVHTLSDDISDGSIFHCDQCSCVFKKLGSLNAHISRFHTEHSDLPVEAGVKNEKEMPNYRSGTDVIQHLLELSEAGGASGDQKEVQESDKTVITDNQGGTGGSAGGDSDILQQALVNSGLPGSEKKKDQIAQTVQTMNIRDSATGLVKKHIIRRIGGVRWHQCLFCTKEFKKPSDLVRHIRIHSHEKPYKCNQCFRAFAVKSTLTAHIRTHTGIKHYKCHVCDKLFSTHGSLKVHTRLHTGAKPFECPHCEKKFRTAAHKKSHVMQHFKDGEIGRERVRERRRRAKPDVMSSTDVPLQEPILITDTGLIQQPPRSNLLNHYLGDSHSVDRPYKCTYCQRGFKKSSHLKQHVRSHTGEKPYKCHQCGRTFVSNGVLKAHIRIHTGIKHYKCMLCETLFTTNGSLKRHMSTHSEVRPFMCPYCQKTFKTSVNCKKHMKTHRHELAFQSSMEQQEGIQLHPSQDPIQTLDHEETHPETEETSFVTEATQNDLDLGQQDLNPTSMMSQQDLSQQSILSQANLQDALGLGSGGLELQQTLNQQIFGQQQTFNQSLLGTGQQNFQALNNQISSINQSQQFSVQPSGMNQLDINSITNASFTAEPVGQDMQTLTNLTNIPVSQPSEEDHAVQQISTATEITDTSIQNILEPQPTNDVNDDDDDDEDSGAPTKHVIARDTTRKYHCEYCDKSFKKSSHLKQHTRSHTGERPFRCAVCGRNFIALGVLRSHLRTHSGVKEFKCNLCNAMFTTNGSLTRHMNVHLSRRILKCAYCAQTFRNDTMLKRHMRNHPDAGDVVTQQAAVPPPSIQLIRVASNKITAGLPGDTALSEKILLESASEKDRISEVRELQVDKGEKHANQCPDCTKSFKKPSDLIRHVRIHTGEKPYGCQVCGRTFTVKSTLDSHMKTHGGIDKTIKCHICSSMFSTKGSLKVHMRLHTGAKPFRCPHCSQRFRTSGHRKSHILSHYKPETTTRKRKSQNTVAQQQTTTDTSTQENFNNFLNNVDVGNNMVQQNQGQVINIDPALLQSSNILPLSLTVDNFGNITDSGQAGQLLQGTDGIQLQLTGVNMPQGIQITGLDPGMFQQTVQIDANLLQQIQSGNVNIAVNPNQMDGQTIAPADPNMVQNIQLQQIQMQEPMNTNIVVQPNVLGQVNVNRAQSQPVIPDMAPNSFVVAADGSFTPEHQQQQQHQIGQPQVAEILTSQQPQPVDIITTDSTNIPENTLKTEHVIDTEIDTGNTELATTASNIEQTVPNEMDSIDPNITQNIANMTADIGEDADDEDEDDDSDVEDNINMDKHASQDSDDEYKTVVPVGEMVHESVGDDMPHDNLDQDNLEEFDSVTVMPPASSAYNPLVMDDDRTHHCSVCNKSFKRSGHLKEHMQIHEGKYKGDKPTPHKCNHCDKSFQKPSQLERHIRIHTGERPFQCRLCEKSFNQKNALQIHLKKHSGEKPHRCSYCDNAFTQKGNLKTHIKRAHHIDMVQSMNLPQPAGQGNEETDTTENQQNKVFTLEEVTDLF